MKIPPHMRRPCRFGSVWALPMLCLLGITSAGAAEGDLDLTFDVDGRVTTDFGDVDEGHDAALQADGRIVVVGTANNGADDDFALARYNVDGSLHTAFDTDGLVVTDFGVGADQAFAVAVQADGKLVVVGHATVTDVEIAIARYNADGSLDTTFDTDGLLTLDIGAGDDWGTSVVLQADGKILVGGYATNDPGGTHDFVVVRLNADGSLDTTFDTDGIVTTDFTTTEDQLEALALQADGSIVAVGASAGDFAVVRYEADGSLDLTFDVDGKVITDIDALVDRASGVAIQADGRIVVAGEATEAVTGVDFALVRYNADGSLDLTFDVDGIVTTDFSGTTDRARDVIVQADGTILAAGSALVGGNNRMAVVRYEADGSLDLDFAVTGMTTVDFSTLSDDAFSVVVQADSSIVLAGGGHATDVSDRDFALARLEGLTVFYQPDNIISKNRNPAAGRGNNIYNFGGGNQSIRLVSRRQSKERAYLFLQNDGSVADRIRLVRPKKNKFFDIRYRSGGNVTAAVNSGNFVTPSLLPGEMHRVCVLIKPDRSRLRDGARGNNGSRKKNLTHRLRSTSVGDPSAKDAVKIKVRHRR